MSRWCNYCSTHTNDLSCSFCGKVLPESDSKGELRSLIQQMSRSIYKPTLRRRRQQVNSDQSSSTITDSNSEVVSDSGSTATSNNIAQVRIPRSSAGTQAAPLEGDHRSESPSKGSS